jgi:hypothetical protein
METRETSGPTHERYEYPSLCATAEAAGRRRAMARAEMRARMVI